MIRETLLSILMAWQQPTAPKGHQQESRSDYDARVSTVVEAALSVTRRPEYLAALTVLVKHESALDPWVHAGLEHPNPFLNQDHMRARRLLQIHENSHIGHDGWLALGGTDFDATQRCFREGLRLLKSAAWLCTHGQMISRSDMERVFAGYAGHGCTPTASSINRARNWAEIIARLRGVSLQRAARMGER